MSSVVLAARCEKRSVKNSRCSASGTLVVGTAFSGGTANTARATAVVWYSVCSRLFM